MSRLFKSILVISVLALGLSACEKYLGDKTNLDFIDIPEFTNRDIAYVPIQPVLNDFVRPVDICVGYDELIYIVDEGTEEVIAMDEAGRVVGRKRIPGAKAVAQDRRFDLLVIGKLDTIVRDANNNILYDGDFAAIYRLRQIAGITLDLNSARVIDTIVHPFYFKNSFSSSDTLVQFNSIGIIGNNADFSRNNQFYVTRSGDFESPVNPDDAVVWFDNQGEFISTIAVNTSSGRFIDYFDEPYGLATLTQPPQITAESSNNFVYTSLAPNNALKVQLIQFNEGEFGAEFRAAIAEAPAPTEADGYINEPNKFTQPYDVTVSGDGSRFVFVADAGTDSIYQFSGNGFEGVLPPAASGETKYQKASFGGTGIGLTQFNEPRAVAFFNDILYVADAGNGRVLRFKLTLDFD